PLLIQTLKEREDMFLMQERTIVALSTLFRRIGSPAGLDWSLWPDVLSGKATDLWRQSEADFLIGFKKAPGAVLWGCDIEVVRPQIMIRELALKNPSSQPLKVMVERTREGYKRTSADELLGLAREAS